MNGSETLPVAAQRAEGERRRAPARQGHRQDYTELKVDAIDA
jgi:ribosomal protein L21